MAILGIDNMAQVLYTIFTSERNGRAQVRVKGKEMNTNETKTFQSKRFGKVEVFNKNDEKLFIHINHGTTQQRSYMVDLKDLESANIPQAVWQEVVNNI